MVLNPRSSAKDIIKAALAAVAGMIVLGLFIIFLGGHDFFSNYSQYKILFHNVKDLTSGRPVKYAGLSIGKVKSIEVEPSNPGKISVIINIDEDFPLYEGTVATVTQKGLVGDNYILLQLNGEAGQKLPIGAQIPAAIFMSMNDVAAEMGKSIAKLVPQLEKAVRGFEKLFSDKNMSNIEKSLEMAPALLSQTNATLVSFGKEWKNLSRTGASAMHTGSKSITLLTAEVADTLQKIEDVLLALEGNLSKTLLNVDGQVVRAVDGIEVLTKDLSRNMEYDQEELEMILVNINRLSREMNRLARSLRERPWQVFNPPKGASDE
ncbi:MlaD family protein [Maridesulfovibrio zosterae]|uniref:MlaD family protein n=1 Tax=Maridesulfovibrio zosterae TaxID=82171 RepID=UPI0004277044|nr:MlaD family protein [Maridesulfovibrio zosterae]